MIEIGLRISRKKNGAIDFSIPAAVRAIFALIAAAIAATGFGGSIGIPGAVLLALSIAASAYEERWIFDPAKKAVVFRLGLLFAARVRAIPFSDVESVETETFEKGAAGKSADSGERKPGRRKRYARLVLHLKDAETLVVETAAASNLERLEAAAEGIARMIAPRA